MTMRLPHSVLAALAVTVAMFSSSVAEAQPVHDGPAQPCILTSHAQRGEDGETLKRVLEKGNLEELQSVNKRFPCSPVIMLRLADVYEQQGSYGDAHALLVLLSNATYKQDDLVTNTKTKYSGNIKTAADRADALTPGFVVHIEGLPEGAPIVKGLLTVSDPDGKTTKHEVTAVDTHVPGSIGSCRIELELRGYQATPQKVVGAYSPKDQHASVVIPVVPHIVTAGAPPLPDFDNGVSLARAGDWNGAALAFARAYREANRVALYNYATCIANAPQGARGGRLARAWYLFTYLAQEGGELAEDARYHADRLHGELVELTVTTTPKEAATLLVDGMQPLSIRQDGNVPVCVAVGNEPGAPAPTSPCDSRSTYVVVVTRALHELRANQEGRLRGDVTKYPKDDDGTKKLAVQLGSRVEPPPRKFPTLSVVLSVASGTGLLVGGITGGIALAKRNEAGDTCQPVCPAEAKEIEKNGQAFGEASNWGFGIGGALGAAAVVGWIVWATDPSPTTTTANLRPPLLSLDLSPTGAALRGTF